MKHQKDQSQITAQLANRVSTALKGVFKAALPVMWPNRTLIAKPARPDTGYLIKPRGEQQRTYRGLLYA